MRSAFGPPIGGPLQPQQPRCHLGVVCVVRPFGLVGMHHGAKKKARSWSVMLIPVFTPAALLGRGSFRSRCVVMATLNASSLDSDASSIANAPLTIAVGEPAQQYWSQIPADPTLYELQTGSALSFRFSTGHNLWLLPTEEAFSACDFSAATELAGLTATGGKRRGGDGAGCAREQHTADAGTAQEVQGGGVEQHESTQWLSMAGAAEEQEKRHEGTRSGEGMQEQEQDCRVMRHRHTPPAAAVGHSAHNCPQLTAVLSHVPHVSSAGGGGTGLGSAAVRMHAAGCCTPSCTVLLLTQCVGRRRRVPTDLPGNPTRDGVRWCA